MVSRRGWDETSDALARRILARARDMALTRGYRPVRAQPGAWEMASYGPADTPAPREGGAQEAETAPSGWKPPPGLGDVGSGPAPSRRDPQTLGGITSRVLAEHGWRRPVTVAGVVGRWTEIVGEQVAEHCPVESFTDGDLVIRADSTAWATQVRILLPQIEKRLAEEIGEGAVTSISVRGPGGPSWKHGRWSVTGGRGPRDTYG